MRGVFESNPIRSSMPGSPGGARDTLLVPIAQIMNLWKKTAMNNKLRLKHLKSIGKKKIILTLHWASSLPSCIPSMLRQDADLQNRSECLYIRQTCLHASYSSEPTASARQDSRVPQPSEIDQLQQNISRLGYGYPSNKRPTHTSFIRFVISLNVILLLTSSVFRPLEPKAKAITRPLSDRARFMSSKAEATAGVSTALAITLLWVIGFLTSTATRYRFPVDLNSCKKCEVINHQGSCIYPGNFARIFQGSKIIIFQGFQG